MPRSRRLAATLAGLALVCVPASIAMANTHSSATKRAHRSNAAPSLNMYRAPAAGRSFRHNGRHCQHRFGNGAPQTSPQSDPQV